MTEALIGTCILAITTVIFVWVCSEYQIYNNEHSAEEKLNTPRLSSWFAAQRMRFWFAVDDAREYPQEVQRTSYDTESKNLSYAGKLIKERLFYHREEEMLNASPSFSLCASTTIAHG